METTNQNEQKAGRIAAALSAMLNALSEFQESQKRIESRQKKSMAELDRYSGLLLQIGKDLEQGLGAIEGRIRSVRASTDSLGKSIESSKEKKPIRWKHHSMAAVVIIGTLGIGLVAGWLWALTWLRVDETERVAMENVRLSMENEKLSLDDEREIGHAVMVTYGHADKERRQLISLLISSDEMNKKQRRRMRKWLAAQVKETSGVKPAK